MHGPPKPPCEHSTSARPCRFRIVICTHCLDRTGTASSSPPYSTSKPRSQPWTAARMRSTSSANRHRPHHNAAKLQPEEQHKHSMDNHVKGATAEADRGSEEKCVPGAGRRCVPAGSGSKFGYLQGTSQSSSTHRDIRRNPNPKPRPAVVLSRQADQQGARVHEGHIAGAWYSLNGVTCTDTVLIERCAPACM